MSGLGLRVSGVFVLGYLEHLGTWDLAIVLQVVFIRNVCLGFTLRIMGLDNLGYLGYKYGNRQKVIIHGLLLTTYYLLLRTYYLLLTT